MASAKSVKMGQATVPVAPEEAEEAAKAEAGEVESVESREVKRDPGRPDTVTVLPRQTGDDTPPDQPPDHWIGIKLTDADGNPMPNERFRLKLDDGSILEGRLDEKGYCRVEGVEPGEAQVCFPDTDSDEWKPA